MEILVGTGKAVKKEKPTPSLRDSNSVISQAKLVGRRGSPGARTRRDPRLLRAQDIERSKYLHGANMHPSIDRGTASVPTSRLAGLRRVGTDKVTLSGHFGIWGWYCRLLFGLY